MSVPAEGYQLKGISPKAYEHPADRAATAALKAVPHLDSVVRRIIEFGYERALRRGVLGSAVRLGEDQLGHVYRCARARLRDARIEPVPDLYITQYPIANALTIGAGAADRGGELGARSSCSTPSSCAWSSRTRPVTCSPNTCSTAPRS